MSNIVIKELPKKGNFETLNLYLKDVKVYFAAIHEPKKKYQSDEKEYSMTVFVDEATKDKLLDEVMVNKGFAQVGVCKTTKPPRRIKFPLSSQTEEGKTNYDLVDGLYGFGVAKPEKSKAGNKMFVNVIDTDGKPFKENVGNGSVCTIKLFGYRNADGQLNITLDTVQVVEHVPYEGGASSGVIEDDVLGVSYAIQREPEESKQGQALATEDDFDSENLPF